MLKRILKWFFGILALALIAAAIFPINLIWFRPWSLNLFYEKVLPKQFSESPNSSFIAGVGRAIRHHRS
jgi:hypothetical protein